MASTFTLVLALLSVQSSYVGEVEKPAEHAPDTIQFWLAPDSQWRIRTYAIDHDIHVYNLGSVEDRKISSDSAVAHIQQHYSDITTSLVVPTFVNPNDKKEVDHVLAEHGLAGALEMSKSGVAFYNPDRSEYRTKSDPNKK